MIARTWKAIATGGNVDRYVAFFRDRLAPELRTIDGHRGAIVTTRGGEIVVTTFWESMVAIARFADPVDVAVVEPEAQALLDSFDAQVGHAEVALDTRY